MNYPCFLVTCLDDSEVEGEPGKRVLATRTVFLSEDEAEQYTKGVAQAREPQVLPCVFPLKSDIRA